MSQFVAISVRQIAEVDPVVTFKVPPIEQLAVLLNALDVTVNSVSDANALEVNDFGRIETSAGAIAWNDGCLDDNTVAVLAIWLLAYFDGHELWMADGSSAIAFRLDPATLSDKLRRKSAGERVLDADRPSNL